MDSDGRAKKRREREREEIRRELEEREIEREADRSTGSGDQPDRWDCSYDGHLDDEEYGDEALALKCLPDWGQVLWHLFSLIPGQGLNGMTGGASVDGTTREISYAVGNWEMTGNTCKRESRGA